MKVAALLIALPLFASAQDTFTWVSSDNSRMELLDRGKPVLVYNYGVQSHEGAPDDRKRCCYIYPLYTPGGVSVLDDFPKDHWHHRGLFWSWPVVETGGQSYDLWMKMTARHRAGGKVSVTEGTLATTNYWEAGGKDIVRENLKLTVMPVEGASRELLVELTWEALGAPVTLKGSREEGKSYGGFSARFADRKGTVLRADGQVLSKDEDLTPRKWAELEGVYGGRKAALRITPEGGPYQWCLRNYGFVGASFPGRTPASDGYMLQPGKPLTLKFRVRVADVQ
jgi:hypothetical protein